MSNNINGGLSPESRKKLDQIKSDGQINFNEVKGLSDAEKNALAQELSGSGKSLPQKEGEITYLYDREKFRSDGSILWEALTNALQTTAQIILTPILSLVACGDITHIKKGDVTNINNNLTFTNDMTTIANLIKELIELEKKGQKRDEDIYNEIVSTLNEYINAYKSDNEEMKKTLEAIISKLEKQNISLDNIIKYLQEANADTKLIAETVVNMLKQLISNGEKLDTIITELGKLGKSNQEIIKLLTENGVKLSDILTSVNVNNAILEDLAGNDAEILELLKNINGNLKISNSTQLQNNEVLNNILTEIAALKTDNSTQFDDVKTLISQMLGILNTHIEAERDMDKEMKLFFDVLLKQLDNMSLQEKNNAEKILKELQTNNKDNKKIIELLTQLGKTTKDIVASLDGIGVTVAEILKYAKESNVAIGDVITELQKLNKSNAEILKALQENGYTLSDILVSLKDNNGILLELSGNNYNIAKMLEKISQIADSIKGEYKEVLDNILNKISEIKVGGNADLTEVEKLLTEILGKLEQQIKNNEKMAANDKKFYDTLLAKLDKLDGSYVKYFEKLIDKLDQMDNNQKEFFTAVLEKLDKLNELSKANPEIKNKLEELLKAIQDNTAVAKETYKVGIKVLEGIDSLKFKADEAIEVLKKLATLKPGDTNVEIDLEDMKAFIKATVQGMIDTYKGGNEKLLAKLNAILNKIPEGCTCDHSELLAKLEIIITKMEQPDGGSHEGIVGDLEDIFG